MTSNLFGDDWDGGDGFRSVVVGERLGLTQLGASGRTTSITRPRSC
jgi:hypothetical protein